MALETIKLSQLAKSHEATVLEIGRTNKALHQKLLSMGIVEGTKIKILSQAPLGGPLSITALGYQISLRKSEAEQVLVQPQ